MQVISLTATPPYDSEPELWERYIRMCGEIDQEITVPELVKEETLCPHQDFVYICSPTAEESEHLRQFEDRKWEYIHQLLVNPDFQALVSGSKVIKGDISSNVLLEDPKYLSAILIYMYSQGLTIPDSLENLLGAKRLPQVNSYWLELLLQRDVYKRQALDNNADVKGTFSTNGQYQIIIGPGDVNFVYAEIIKKTGLKEVSTDDLKEIANKDKKFNPLMDLIKLLSDIFVPIIPALVAGGLLMALRNFLTSPDLFGPQSIEDMYPCLLYTS